MARRLPLALSLVLAVVVGACSLLPAEVTRDLAPLTRSTYRTAEFAYNNLIEQHVDRPGSELLLGGALDAVDAFLAEAGTAPTTRPTLTGSVRSDFERFAETLDRVRAAQPSVDATLMERAATSGMAQSLDECHTYYLDPPRARSFNQGPAEYGGIGAQIAPGAANEMPEISSVFADSPAERAGIRGGDRIRSVDGQNVTGYTPEEVANRIRGEDGSTVSLVLVRDGSEQRHEIVRARITPPRVQGRTYEDGAIGYVSVAQLNGDVAQQTSDEVERLIASGSRGIILDLRNNPGGDLSAAVQIGSIFVRGTLVYQIGRNGDRQSLRTQDRWYWEKPQPLVVLVNERSASGSEIISAGVQANGAGAVVGARTAGCVGIGQPREMPDGGLLLITIARMQDARTGAELNGEGLGVQPDRQVQLDPAISGDTQLDSAVSYLRSRI